MNEILVPTGLAELIDQIIIVQGKLNTASDPTDRRILSQRLNVMQRVAARVSPQSPPFDQLRKSVVSARHDITQLEADLRACEARSEFDVAFVALARAYLQAQVDLDAHKLALDTYADQTLPESVSADRSASGPS